VQQQCDPLLTLQAECREQVGGPACLIPQFAIADRLLRIDERQLVATPFGDMALAICCRVLGLRDFGPAISPFNAFMILILAPIFSFIWALLGRVNLDPNPALKFGLALVQVGAGFYVLVWGTQFADDSFKVPMIFLFLTYLLHTTGELFLSPVGLSQMTKLAPAAVASTIMATWFLASSWAQYIGGYVAQMTATETVAGQVLDPQKALATYVTVFELIGTWGLYIGAGLIVLSPILRYLAHEGTEK
jgi:POT family proton-dependent oligopeptide transporter